MKKLIAFIGLFAAGLFCLYWQKASKEIKINTNPNT